MAVAGRADRSKPERLERLERLERRVGALERWLLGLVVIAAALAIANPAPGRRLAAAAITPTLALLVLASGLAVTPHRLRAARPLLPRLLLALTASTVALPLLALAASRLVADPAQRGGVLAVGVAPAEVAAVAVTAVAGGEVAVAAALLVASTGLCVLLAGPILAVLAVRGGSLGGSVEVGGSAAAPTPPAAILGSLLLVVGLPLAVGMALRAYWPRAQVLGVAGRGGSVATVVVLVWLVASQASLSLGYVRVVLALVVVAAGAAALGWSVGWGLARRWRLGLGLPVAMRDFAVAAGIATVAFGPKAAAPLGVYGIVVMLLGAGVARWARRRRAGHPATPAPAGGPRTEREGIPGGTG